MRWRHKLDVYLRVPRPWPERPNEEGREQFQEERRARGADPKVELLMGDESGFEGAPRRRGAQPGKVRIVPYLGDHLRQNVIGAVAPRSGALLGLIVDGVDTDVFQFFLELTWPGPYRKRKACDRSSFWPTPRGPKRRGGVGPIWSRSFCQATGRTSTRSNGLWLRVQAEWCWDFLARTPEELTGRLCTALKRFVAQPDKTASACATRQ